MYHLHPNGKGIVADQADASLQAFIDSDSLISTHASVDSGHTSMSLVTGDSRISNSTIVSSLIECDRVVDSFVFQSKLQGKVVVRSSHVERVSLIGTIIAEGRLSDFSIECHHPSDYLRINGTWTRPPRFFDAGKYIVSEGRIINGEQYIQIGCRCDTASNWLARSDKLASRLGIDFVLVRDFINSLNSESDSSSSLPNFHL